ncbi:MAG: photosynthetic complex putative assembly protein PuhB [Pseudomonadota bacterium]
MDQDEFQTEPVRGLPEVPPEGEQILWQGAPDWWALSKDALKVHWVAGYFLVLAGWRFGSLADGGLGSALEASLAHLIAGSIACAILILIAVVQARSTVYTITNRRIAMRIGAALTLTVNIPYRWVGSADLDLRKNGTGTVALSLTGESRLSYLVCWPHVRPWHFSPTQPALRCIPDAEKVSRMFGESARARLVELSRDPRKVDAVPVPAE